MTEHLNRASEYLALAESQLTGTPSDNLFLAIAHSLVGTLVSLEDRVTALESAPTPAPASEVEPLPAVRRRVCVLCGRGGSRQFEESPVGLVCTHVVKCAERRHTESEED